MAWDGTGTGTGGTVRGGREWDGMGWDRNWNRRKCEGWKGDGMGWDGTGTGTGGTVTGVREMAWDGMGQELEQEEL